MGDDDLHYLVLVGDSFEKVKRLIESTWDIDVDPMPTFIDDDDDTPKHILVPRTLKRESHRIKREREQQ